MYNHCRCVKTIGFKASLTAVINHYLNDNKQCIVEEERIFEPPYKAQTIVRTPHERKRVMHRSRAILSRQRVTKIYPDHRANIQSYCSIETVVRWASESFEHPSLDESSIGIHRRPKIGSTR